MAEKIEQKRKSSRPRRRSASGAVTVTIAGESFHLDREQVIEAMSEHLPEPIQEHFVVIDGRRFPPKQVIGALTGLDRADFTTHQARRVLRRLGFTAARRIQPTLGSDEPWPRRTPRNPEYVEALRPYIGKWVATKGNEVLVGADSLAEVVGWLEQHDQVGDSLFRVPESEAAAGGMAPL